MSCMRLLRELEKVLDKICHYSFNQGNLLGTLPKFRSLQSIFADATTTVTKLRELHSIPMQILSFSFDRNYIHSCEWNAPRTRFWQTCAITGNLINLPDKNRGQVLSQSFYSPKRGSGGIIRGFYGKQTEQRSTQTMCYVNRERFQKFFCPLYFSIGDCHD